MQCASDGIKQKSTIVVHVSFPFEQQKIGSRQNNKKKITLKIPPVKFTVCKVQIEKCICAQVTDTTIWYANVCNGKCNAKNIDIFPPKTELNIKLDGNFKTRMSGSNKQHVHSLDESLKLKKQSPLVLPQRKFKTPEKQIRYVIKNVQLQSILGKIHHFSEYFRMGIFSREAVNALKTVYFQTGTRRKVATLLSSSFENLCTIVKFCRARTKKETC